MTKTERKALENYSEYLWDMKKFHEAEFNETGDNWSKERAESYRESWATMQIVLRMLEVKDDIKFWANTEV